VPQQQEQWRFEWALEPQDQTLVALFQALAFEWLSPVNEAPVARENGADPAELLEPRDSRHLRKEHPRTRRRRLRASLWRDDDLAELRWISSGLEFILDVGSQIGAAGDDGAG